MIICCDNIEDTYYEISKCLFIIKKVKNYETQYINYQIKTYCKKIYIVFIYNGFNLF
jgi:hypothetical protein